MPAFAVATETPEGISRSVPVLKRNRKLMLYKEYPPETSQWICCSCLRQSAEINVETFKGVVQLSGFVSSPANINRAVEITRGVSGVTSVRNDMRLK